MKTKSRAFAFAVWHPWHPRANDGLVVAGLKVSDDASYTNVAYPHPFVSGNRFESFTMKDISVCVPDTVTP